MDLMCMCFVSVRAMMFGFGCALRRGCRSNIVVCIPRVLRVRAVMAGWVLCTGVLFLLVLSGFVVCGLVVEKVL